MKQDSQESRMTPAGSPKPKESPDQFHPPLPPLALRIGVTGHKLDDPDFAGKTIRRNDPDIPAVRNTIQEILSAVSAAFIEVAAGNNRLFNLQQPGDNHFGGGILRIVSSLASGSDQWVAEEGLKKGYELQAILPFPANAYLQDFTRDGDAAAFRSLCSSATAILELDGQHPAGHEEEGLNSGNPYEALGRVLLNQIDILIAIWDGQPAHGPGGTGRIVHDARQCGIPVIWIPWDAPQSWNLYHSGELSTAGLKEITSNQDQLSQIFNKLLLPPVEEVYPEVVSGKTLCPEYFMERQKSGNPLLGIWQVFRYLVCGDLFTKTALNNSLQAFRVNDFETPADNQSQNSPVQTSDDISPEPPVISQAEKWADDRFLHHYKWANGLSLFYGNMYRSAFIVNYLLGALAVFLAMICIAQGITGKEQTGWILTELSVIAAIMLLTFLGKHKKWHQRWIDYRMLAERLRIARYLVLIGGGNLRVAGTAHLSTYGNPASTWMNWLYLAIERAAGIIPVSFTGNYLSACRKIWRDNLLQQQIDYHKNLSATFSKMDHRLHKTGEWLFIATLIACLFHLGHLWLEEADGFHWIPLSLSGWMTLFCAFFPALGAAFSAIRSQSEVQRLAQRSKAMEASFMEMYHDFDRLTNAQNSPESPAMRKCADRVSHLMINEMLDWRVVFQDRPLGLPA